MSSERDWALIVSAYGWAASLKGDASVAGFDTDVDIPFSDVLDHLDFVAMGNAELTNGQWGFYLDLQHVKTSQGEELLSHELDLEINTTHLSGGAFFKAWEWDLGGQTVNGRPRTVSIEPTAGLRWTKLEAEVSAFGLSASRDVDWTDAFVGLRVNADLTERWNLWAEADVGGFDPGKQFSVNAQAYLGYRTVLFGKSALLRAGYRYLRQEYETTDFTGTTRFKWDVAQQGPVVGLSIRF